MPINQEIAEVQNDRPGFSIEPTSYSSLLNGAKKIIRA
jgi:hypothetical protein